MRILKYWRGYKNINAHQFNVPSGEWILTWENRKLSPESAFSIDVLDGNEGRIAHVAYTTESGIGFREFYEDCPILLRINSIDQVFEVEVWATPEK
ncbi:MAG: hypothetical protein ACYS8W_03230 [Planctomycetota bacterium]